MHGKGWKIAALLGAGLLGGRARTGIGAEIKAPVARCSRVVLEGEVQAGQSFRRSFAGGLDLLLEPIASGWVVRVVPTAGPRPAEDYAEIATPPYRSVSPLLLSTDFSFRAQDAVGWNPRRFRYAADARAFSRLEVAYRRVLDPKTASAAESELAGLVAKQPEGVLEIVDASLAPGTADPTRAAALVSSHFDTTAHRLNQPEGGRSTPLGKIDRVRFRVRLEMAPGSKAAPGLKLERYVCGRG